MAKQKQPKFSPPKTIMICLVMVVVMFFYFFSSTLMTTGTATSAGRRQWTEHTDTFTTDWTKPRCQSWSANDANNRTLQPFDLWHTHHPNWIVTSENEDEFCVSVEPAGKSPIIRNMMFFYANQFLSSCKLVHTRYQWGSGWSADFYNINLGLIHALYYRVPCIITSWEQNNPQIGIERTHPWNYAANKKDHGQTNQTSLVCEAGDTTCYFLPYHGCGQIDKLKNDSSAKLLQAVEDKGDVGSAISNEVGWSGYQFVTRKQLWLRRAVFDYKEKFKRESNWSEKSDCTVIHVRRGDVVHDGRRYYPVAFYVEMIPEEKLYDPDHYVFLLADDSDAIAEAHEFFPDIKWVHFDRPRPNGYSGWENHTPSGDPALDVIVILSAFDLVQDCSTLVHGRSGFSDYIYQYVSKVGIDEISFIDIAIAIDIDIDTHIHVHIHIHIHIANPTNLPSLFLDGKWWAAKFDKIQHKIYCFRSPYECSPAQ